MILKKRIALNAKFGAERNRGKAFTSSIEEFDEVINSNELSELISKIRTSTDKKEQDELKAQLPFRCAHYSAFVDNRRDSSHVAPEHFMYQTVVDIDEIEYVDCAIERAMLLNTQDGIWKDHVLKIERSARGKAHIDIRLPIGMTVEESQKQFCAELGVPYDSSCITRERFIYLVDKGSEIYRSPMWCAILPEEEIEARRKAFADRGLPIDGYAPKQKATETVKSHEEKVEVSKVKYDEKLVFANGILYKDIVNKFWELYYHGQEPVEGTRNSDTFDLALHIRTICDYDIAKMMQVIPNYWGPEGWTEYRDTLINANSVPRKGMPYKMRNVLEAVRKDRFKLRLSDGNDDVNGIPVYAKKKPDFIQLISSKADKSLRAMIEESVWPALCAYLSGNVKFRYIDGKMHEANISSVLIGKQSTGKGYINEPLEAIMADINVNDDISRQKLDEWRKKCRKKGKDQGEEPRPDDVCIQRLEGSITPTRFAEAQMDADKNGLKRCYTRVDEIELLKGISRNNSEELFALIRAAFDTSTWGRDAVGAQFISGSFNVRYVFNASCTPVAAHKFITSKWVNDGTLTRLCVNTIFESENMPRVKEYDSDFYKKVRFYIERLKSANGVISCPKADKLVKEMIEEHKRIAEESGLEGYKKYSYRACVMGWLKACILYIMNDYKWEKCIADYVRYSVKRDMWCKMFYFGKDIEEGNSDTDNHRVTVQSVLALLPSEFSEADYMKKVEELGRKGNKGTLRTWCSRGKIYYDDASNMYVKCTNDVA